MVRSWLVVACVAGCTSDDAHTQWFDSGSYAADYAAVGGGQAHVAYLDTIMYLAWESPARLHAIHLCDEHQLAIKVPQAASAGEAQQLVGLVVTIDGGLCQLGDHRVKSGIAVVVRSTDTSVVPLDTWDIGGTLSVASYVRHPADAAASAPGGTPEELIQGTFELALTDPTNRTGQLAGGTFDFSTASYSIDTDPFE